MKPKMTPSILNVDGVIVDAEVARDWMDQLMHHLRRWWVPGRAGVAWKASAAHNDAVFALQALAAGDAGKAAASAARVPRTSLGESGRHLPGHEK